MSGMPVQFWPNSGYFIRDKIKEYLNIKEPTIYLQGNLIYLRLENEEAKILINNLLPHNEILKYKKDAIIIPYNILPFSKDKII